MNLIQDVNEQALPTTRFISSQSLHWLGKAVDDAISRSGPSTVQNEESRPSDRWSGRAEAANETHARAV